MLTILIKGDNKPYNVGSANALQIGQLAEEVCNVLAATNKITVCKEPDRECLPERYIPSVERVKSLGLREITSFKDAVLKTADWNKTKLEHRV